MWNSFLQRIKLDWLQIEVSSYCNSSCLYCPQTAYKKVWKKQLLDLEQIKKVLPYLHPKTYIHLQGWGEPFTHPQLLSTIQFLKTQGFKVGTTTNGTLLSPDCMEKLVDMGLDIIAFSTAGCSAEENDSLRQGTSLKKVIACIETLNKLKATKKSPYPKLHIAQMLMRSSLPHISSYPPFWKNLGVDQVVLSSLSLVTRPELQTEARLADSVEEWDDLKQELYEMRVNTGLQHILHFHLVSPFMIFNHCSENIEKSAVIGSDGVVAPCVMVNLPVTEPVQHWSYGEAGTKTKMGWGTIQQQDFKTIWKRPDYKLFRNQEVLEKDQCSSCLKRCIETMDTAYRIDPSSMTCRWQVIKEANEEKEAMRRMQARLHR